MGALRRARALLGATRSTDEEQLRKLYRKHALKTHPDKPGGDIEAFQRVASAYELCRAHLGQSLTAAEWAADDRPTEYYDPNDRGRKSQRPAARRPDDAIDPFEVFSDAFRGWAESAEFQQWAVDAFGDDFDQLDITFQWGVDDQYVEVARERSLVENAERKFQDPRNFYEDAFNQREEADDRLRGLMDVVLRMGADRSPPVHVFRDLASLVRGDVVTVLVDARRDDDRAGDLAPPPRCAVVRLCVDDCVDGDGRPALAYGVADSGGPGNADDVVVAKTLRESRVLHQDPTVLEGGANLWDHLRNPRSSLIYVVRKGGAIVRRGASLQSDFVAELEEGAVVAATARDAANPARSKGKDRLRVASPAAGFVTASRLVLSPDHAYEGPPVPPPAAEARRKKPRDDKGGQRGGHAVLDPVLDEDQNPNSFAAFMAGRGAAEVAAPD
ncbi:hypothetical protein SO694_000651105 [Aureococcus anophagefferens]|uniref:J domain-containing protein n=1 Tax=Aureococcus anophagefferens TaxID=44056 RepID=A0ABR1FR37_AURAN